METYVRSTEADNRDVVNEPSRRAPRRVGDRIAARQVATLTFALALGFALGLVFHRTENLGFLEWVMVVLAIAAMAAGYYIRGMEFDRDEARPLSRSDQLSNVIRLASRQSPVRSARPVTSIESTGHECHR
jgi:multisubunit Na+/H+ antiporter MnhB subunit